MENSTCAVMPDLSHGEYALIHTGSDPGVQHSGGPVSEIKTRLVVFTIADNGVQVWTRILAEAFDGGKEILGRAG